MSQNQIANHLRAIESLPRAMAPLRYAAKFDPFLSLDCAPNPSTLAQSKERKGSNFAIWQPSVQTLVVPAERVNETTFVMNVTNSPEESVEDDESSGVSRNPTPTEAATSRDADKRTTDLGFQLKPMFTSVKIRCCESIVNFGCSICREAG